MAASIKALRSGGDAFYSSTPGKPTLDQPFSERWSRPRTRIQFDVTSTGFERWKAHPGTNYSICFKHAEDVSSTRMMYGVSSGTPLLDSNSDSHSVVEIQCGGAARDYLIVS
jgi:hypothetical protein